MKRHQKARCWSSAQLREKTLVSNTRKRLKSAPAASTLGSIDPNGPNLWPSKGPPPIRCSPSSLDVAGSSRVLLRTHQILVLEKPPDVAMDGNPSSGVTVDTLVRHWCEKDGNPLEHPHHFCHRLDFGTSGILVLGLNRAITAVCGSAFAERTVKKVYSAVCCGELNTNAIPWSADPLMGAYRRPKEDAGGDTFVINGPLAPKSPGDFLMAVFLDSKSAGEEKPVVGLKAARTLVQVLETIKYCGHSVTRLRLTPLTGRRHQLRVHLNHLGHPLVGDATYDGGALAGLAPRMMLHAMELTIPLGPGGVLQVTTPDPFPSSAGELQPLIQVPLEQCRAEVTTRLLM